VAKKPNNTGEREARKRAEGTARTAKPPLQTSHLGTSDAAVREREQQGRIQMGIIAPKDFKGEINISIMKSRSQGNGEQGKRIKQGNA